MNDWYTQLLLTLGPVAGAMIGAGATVVRTRAAGRPVAERAYNQGWEDRAAAASSAADVSTPWAGYSDGGYGPDPYEQHHETRPFPGAQAPRGGQLGGAGGARVPAPPRPYTDSPPDLSRGSMPLP